MIKKYYMTINKKTYVGMMLTLIGSISLLFNLVIVPVALLVVIITLFDGPFNKDLFVVQNDRVYFMNGTERVSFRILSLVLIFVGFALCLSQFYTISLCIFYGLILIIYVFNIFLSGSIKKTIDSVDDLIFEPVDGYTTYEILEVVDNKVSFTFTAFDKFSRETYNLEYKLNPSFIDYKELLSKLKSKIKEEVEEN